MRLRSIPSYWVTQKDYWQRGCMKLLHAILQNKGKGAGLGSTLYYHKKDFRDQCIKLGLDCHFLNTRYGWTITQWPKEGVPSKYASIVTYLLKKLPKGLGERRKVELEPKPLPKSGHFKLTCGCTEENRTVYVKKSVYEAGGVECAFCKERFR